jgi:hypothetical protein
VRHGVAGIHRASEYLSNLSSIREITARAPELPGLLPADARYYRSRRAMQFGIGGSSG